MDSTVLYRKYRPGSFEEVLGQDHIVKVLRGSIEKGSISHAYLFCGGRGTGKTSIARILAKELDVKPTDVYEIDAASNTGVEDIRQLNESIQSLPFDSKYKVYIIDEVHMLSKPAFNALLKTLEEPPGHVIFVLATTEQEKLLDTVISRCQLFEFQKPTERVLKEMVLNIAEKEGYTIEESSGELMAVLGDGSFRDTLGILQKVLGFSKDKKISEKEILDVTGAPSNEKINYFLTAIEDQDPSLGLETLNSAYENGADMKIFTKMLLFKVRLILLLRFSPKKIEDIKNEVNEKDFDFLKTVAENKKTKIKSDLIPLLIEALKNSEKTPLPTLPLEMVLMKSIDQDGEGVV